MLAGVEQLHTFTVISTSFISFIPLMNPLCTIAIIRPYRQALLGCVAALVRPVAPQLHSIFKGSRVATTANALPSEVTAADLTRAPATEED